MLVLDRVLFDTHIDVTEDTSAPADLVIERMSFAQIVKQSIAYQSGSGSLVGSQVEVENAIKRSLARSMRQEEKFAAGLKRAMNKGEAPTEITVNGQKVGTSMEPSSVL